LFVGGFGFYFVFSTGFGDIQRTIRLRGLFLDYPAFYRFYSANFRLWRAEIFTLFVVRIVFCGRNDVFYIVFLAVSFSCPNVRAFFLCLESLALFTGLGYTFLYLELLILYMDSEKLEYFKQRLFDERVQLEKELADLGSNDPDKMDATYPESGSNSDEDNAAEVTEYADIVSMEARMQSELKDVNTAIKLFDEGKYGICKYCSNEIDEKRLEARPASSSCIACKKVLTQEL
jgi:DnaK suppressor protein